MRATENDLRSGCLFEFFRPTVDDLRIFGSADFGGKSEAEHRLP
jgi:hypothetical protein